MECFMRYLILTILVVSIFSATTSWGANYVTPTTRQHEMPTFEDDLDFQNMVTALDRQIAAYRRGNLSGTIKMGTVFYPRQRLLDSAIYFKGLVQRVQACISKIKTGRATPKATKESCMKSFNNSMKNEYNLYIPDLTTTDLGYYSDRPALFTAYYSPELVGSRVKSRKYKFAIYAKPKESSLARLTREEIDFERKLDGKGYELFYVENLFDLYILHIEGGGQVSVINSDGGRTSYFISYASSNGQKFRWISRYMRDQGMIDNSSVDAQRNYLETHPDKWQEVYSQCESYIFFKVTDHPPLGVNDIPLTDFRSIATDRKYYKQKGLISYVVAQKPVRNENGEIVFKAFARFFLDQDTGGAIKGKARADLYFGVGLNGELAAHNLKNYGEIYFLIKKKKLECIPQTDGNCQMIISFPKSAK